MSDCIYDTDIYSNFKTVLASGINLTYIIPFYNIIFILLRTRVYNVPQHLQTEHKHTSHYHFSFQIIIVVVFFSCFTFYLPRSVLILLNYDTARSLHIFTFIWFILYLLYVYFILI